MKKLLNDVGDMLRESLDGFGAAHGDLVKVHHDPTFVTRRAGPVAGQVGLISGGGSGHEPLHAGFVGAGMLAAACPGEVFTSPTPDQMLAAAESVDGGAGVLFIVKNYSGDVMNFEMAAEMYVGPSATVLVNDDVAVEDSSFTTGRRGVAGTVVVEKIVGAVAATGADLATCAAFGNRVNGATRSMGLALTSCTVPAAGSPTFVLANDEIEMGVGIHGEPGRRRIALAPASELAQEMMGAILDEVPAGKGDSVLLLVNGFGGTPLMELYLMYGEAARLCADRGLAVARSHVGNVTTSLEMQGCSFTVTALDDETTGLWDAPVHTPALRWRC